MTARRSVRSALIAPIQVVGDPQISTIQGLEAAMAAVSFTRSCLDMGWKWQVRSIPPGKPLGWLMRCSFQRPDRTTGKVGRGFGRWWYIERLTTKSAVQKTMFAAAKMIVEHELMEAFKVNGKRPFDPHRTVADLTTAFVTTRMEIIG